MNMMVQDVSLSEVASPLRHLHGTRMLTDQFDIGTALIRANRPIPPQIEIFCYEVEIIECPENGLVVFILHETISSQPCSQTHTWRGYSLTELTLQRHRNWSLQ